MTLYDKIRADQSDDALPQGPYMHSW